MLGNATDILDAKCTGGGGRHGTTAVRVEGVTVASLQAVTVRGLESVIVDRQQVVTTDRLQVVTAYVTLFVECRL